MEIMEQEIVARQTRDGSEIVDVYDSLTNEQKSAIYHTSVVGHCTAREAGVDWKTMDDLVAAGLLTKIGDYHYSITERGDIITDLYEQEGDA